MISVVGIAITSSNSGTQVCVSVRGVGVNSDARLLIRGVYYKPYSALANGGVTTYCFKLPKGVTGNAVITFSDAVDEGGVGIDV